MSLKPFDLEKALAGEPVVTRDGREVGKIVYFPTASNSTYRIYAEIEGEVQAYTEEGVWMEGFQNGRDLFMAPKKRTVWVNLYPDEKDDSFFTQYDSKQAADKAAGNWKNYRLGNKAHPIEIEE